MKNEAIELIDICNDDIDNEFYSLKERIDKIIDEILENKQRLVFASVVKAAEITQITVFRYPKIRTYILEQIKKKKEIECINNRIEKVVAGMNKRNIRLTYMGIINRCKFTTNEVKNYPIIKEKIKKAVIKGSKDFYKNLK